MIQEPAGEKVRLIEEKLSRLTPEQRREVEDYIDFLMSRDRNPEQHSSPGNSGSYSEIRDFSDLKKDTLFGSNLESSSTSGDDLLPDYPEYGDMGRLSGNHEPDPDRSLHQGGKPVPRKTNSGDPSQLLDWLE